MTESPSIIPKEVSHNLPRQRWMLRRIALNVYIVLVGAYGLNVSLLLVLRAIIGERWEVVALFNSYLHLLILPAVILLPLSLAFGRHWLAVELAAPFFLFISIYGGQFLPRGSSAPADAPRLRLLSFNINKDNSQVEDIVGVIRESQADVVAIQELSPWVADAVTTQLAAFYPYQALHPQADFSGQGVLSRYPLSGDAYWQIHLGHQSLSINWNGDDIVLFNVHPIHPLRGFHFDGQSRAEEIDAVLQLTEQVSTPLLMAGDFNMTSLSDDYARVTKHYGDTYAEIGWGMGFGFPNFAAAFHINYLPPIARIDYIFHDSHFTPVDIRVGTAAAGSDHFPIYATFALNETS